MRGKGRNLLFAGWGFFLLLMFGTSPEEIPLKDVEGFKYPLKVGNYSTYEGKGVFEFHHPNLGKTIQASIEGEVRQAIVGEELMEEDEKNIAYWWQEIYVKIQFFSEEFGSSSTSALLKVLLPRDNLLKGQRITLGENSLKPRKIILQMNSDKPKELKPEEFEILKQNNPFLFLAIGYESSGLKKVSQEKVETPAGTFETYRYYVSQKFKNSLSENSNSTSSNFENETSMVADIWASNSIPFGIAIWKSDMQAIYHLSPTASTKKTKIEMSLRIHLTLRDYGENAVSLLKTKDEKPGS